MVGKFICFTAIFSVLLWGAVKPAFADEGAYGVALEGFGGVADNEGILAHKGAIFSGGLTGSLAFRASDAAVVQVDSLFGGNDGKMSAAGAVHVGFDLGRGAFAGLVGSYSSTDVPGLFRPRVSPFLTVPIAERSPYAKPVDSWRMGGELRVHRGPFTLEGTAGIERVSHRDFLLPAYFKIFPPFFSYEIPPGLSFQLLDRYGRDTSFFDMIDIRMQITDRFSISAGHRYIGGNHAAAFGVDFKVSDRLSLFADGRRGEGTYDTGWIGIRIGFGKKGNHFGTFMLTNRLKDEMFAVSNTKESGNYILVSSPTTGGLNALPPNTPGSF